MGVFEIFVQVLYEFYYLFIMYVYKIIIFEFILYFVDLVIK